ncbi:hypothetical protein QJS66_19265 [Kocuria rhizophila]|nr:hypothetical protein QJS66_19265 [Kocuria rhizophila]
MDGKTNTYVLDFVNDPDQILAAFQESAGRRDQSALGPGPGDQRLEKLARPPPSFTDAEVDQVWDVEPRPQAASTGTAPGLDPAVARFMERWDRAGDDAAERDALEEFRSLLGQYVTSYAFFSQILNFGDPEFVELSVFADLLGASSTPGWTPSATVTAEDVVLTRATTWRSGAKKT